MTRNLACMFGLHRWRFLEIWNPPGFALILYCYECARCGKEAVWTIDMFVRGAYRKVKRAIANR